MLSRDFATLLESRFSTCFASLHAHSSSLFRILWSSHVKVPRASLGVGSCHNYFTNPQKSTKKKRTRKVGFTTAELVKNFFCFDFWEEEKKVGFNDVLNMKIKISVSNTIECCRRDIWIVDPDGSVCAQFRCWYRDWTIYIKANQSRWSLSSSSIEVHHKSCAHRARDRMWKRTETIASLKSDCVRLRLEASPSCWLRCRFIVL